MKFYLFLILLLPVCLMSQEQNPGTESTQYQKNNVSNTVIFTNDGKLRFPDGTEQTTAYRGNNKQLGFLPSEFGITSQGGVKFPDNTIQTTAYIPNNNPPQDFLTPIVVEFGTTQAGPVTGPAQGPMITDGLNDIASVVEGLSIPVDIGSGGSPVGLPSFD